MIQKLTVHLDRPCSSVRVLNGSSISTEGEVFCHGSTDTKAPVDDTFTQELEAEKAAYFQARQTLDSIIAKLNQFCDEVFSSHKEEIAKLSMEIARKVLMQKVENGDYEIESIVQEAIKKAPRHDDIVIHLNPHDLSACQEIQQNNGNEDLAGIKFVADTNINRAECIVENPKGVVKSLIDEHLEQIGRALNKV